MRKNEQFGYLKLDFRDRIVEFFFSVMRLITAYEKKNTKGNAIGDKDVEVSKNDEKRDVQMYVYRLKKINI